MLKSCLIAGWLLLFIPAVARAASVTVDITNFAFNPKDLTIAPGTEVIWVNHDAEPHSAVSASDPKTFKSPALDTEDRFAFVFHEAGTYAYFCSLHPHMQGTIIVAPNAEK